MLKFGCSECIVVNQCEIRAANAGHFARVAADAPEALEKAEIEARLRYTEVEETLLQGGTMMGFNDGQLLDLFGQLLDDVEKRSEEAPTKYPVEEAKWLQRKQDALARKDAAISKCGRVACFAAGVLRTLGINQFACGSTDNMARATVYNFSKGRKRARLRDGASLDD